MSDKKLFLLDGMALIYRAYHAFKDRPMINSRGLNTSAMFGLTNTLLEVLNKEKPSHIGVVFDTSAPTERHTVFEAYKAHRQEMPEDLVKSLPYIFRLIEAFNIPVITKDGFEADDVIGTLAKKAEKENFTTFMMTPDKDFGQLVSEKIFIYKPARMGNEAEVMGIEEVKKKWEIEHIDQVRDILGLWGDAVDNIPGIPGYGEKTAKVLIAKYGSIENLIEHAHELKGKQKERLVEHAEQALLSKRLATIDCNSPVELNPKELEVEKPDEEKIKVLFAELEFKSLLKRVLGESVTPLTTAGSQPSLFDAVQPEGNNPKKTAADAVEEPELEMEDLKTIEDVPHTYLLVDTKEKREELIGILNKQKSFCFDTETTGLDAMDAEVIGMSFSCKDHEAWFVVLPENHDEATEVVKEFIPLFENEKIEKIGQNIKFDSMALYKYGVELKGKIFDTMLAHYLIEPDKRHNMDYLSEQYLGYRPVSITTLIGKKGAGQLSMRGVDLEKLTEYAAEDADVTWQLKAKLEPMLKEHKALKVFNDIEIPLIRVLAAMEREGIRIDSKALGAFSAELEGMISELEKEIYELSGVKFNIASPKQLGEVLFDKLKLDPKAKKTKTGQYQTGEEILAKLALEHELPQKILDIRSLQKLKSTYVDALPTMINKGTGRVHTSFNQAVAATGRLSSNNPNLQNIPIRTEKGREVRKAFVPRDKDHLLISADYSQIELRIIASVSKDKGMMEAFEKGLDIHTATAAKIFGVSLEEVDKEMRRKAKTVNFGIIYGISAFGLSQRLDIPRKEAAHIIEQYFQQFPNIQKYMDETIQFAQENGYVETLMGRRRYIRDINSANQTVRGFAERNAINAPIQGSAADMIKLAMIKIHDRLENSSLKTKMILQVHDELLFDVPRDEVDKVKEMIISEMETALPLKVPVVVEAGVGESWLEAH